MSNVEPKLAPPGAGLPWPQKWIVPFIVPRLARRDSWANSAARFAREGESIRRIVDSLDTERIGTRVLVPRLPGLEDSSRYWSVAMTLEHLIIVSEGIAEIIVKLSRGETISHVVDTARVKPHAEVDAPKAIADFSPMIARVQQKLESEVTDRASVSTHPHPWFGPFTAHQWHWLLGSHLVIHKRQIREIVARLPVKTNRS